MVRSARRNTGSLLDRRIEKNGILKTARELGVTIIAYTPLESGLLTGKYHKHPELLEKKSAIWRGRLPAFGETIWIMP